MSDESLHRFDTGAVRSSDADSARFDLVSPVGLRRLAETYAEGAGKYGDHNWLKGMPFSSIINHLEAHIVKYKRTPPAERKEDDLAHAAWGLFALMHFEETNPELDDLWFHRKDGSK